MEKSENPNVHENNKTISSTLLNDFKTNTKKDDLSKNSESFSTSRYGRARKPKITDDYYCSDEAISPMLSPIPEKKITMAPNSTYKIKNKKNLKNYYLEPVNGFKSRLTLDDTTSLADIESDYNSLLKIISKPATIESISPTSPTFKLSSLKTYSNRKKRTSECSNKSFNEVLSKLDSFSWTQNLIDSNIQSSTPEKSIKSNAKRKLYNSLQENGKIKNKIAEDILLEFCEIENDIKLENCENNVTSSDNQSSGVSRFIESDLYLDSKENKNKNESFNKKEIENKKLEEVQSPIIDSSTQIKQESTPVSQEEWNVGDLIWSRVGNHPLWPSIITREPGSNLFIQEKSVGRSLQQFLHVRFFADCGRRGWVPAGSALKFNGKKAFEEMAEVITSEMKKKRHRKYTSGFTIQHVNKKLSSKWYEAVSEAESLMLKTVNERLTYFAQIIANNNKKKKNSLIEKERKFEKNLEDSHVEKTNSINNIENCTEYKTSRKMKNSNIVKKIQENQIVNDDLKEKQVENYFKNNYPVRERKTVERYNSSSFTHPLHIDIEIKKEEDDSCDDTGELKNKTVNEKVATRTSTPSNSSTPSISLKKKNLFKGVPKDKLCQICEKPKNVFKCRGCMRSYHYKCATNPEKYKSKRVQQNIDEDESSTELDNENNEKIAQKTIENKSIESIKTVSLTLAEQIDAKMAEMMKDCDKTKYAETSTEESGAESDNNSINEKLTYHVTGDSVTTTIVGNDKKIFSEFKCKDCTENRIAACFICGNYENVVNGIKSCRQKCSFVQCGRVYHPKCLKTWPQTGWTISQSINKKEAAKESLICPIHVCHTCVSDDPRGSSILRISKDKLAKCIRCPTAYHASNYCVPAGSEILSYNQLICPKHISKRKIRKSSDHVNASWCFICAIGGSLICCETCPTSFHAECLQINPPEGSFICEDCETGRLPLYNEVVWVKLGTYRWWPAQILFPYEIPDNISSRPHQIGEFVVKFFGTYNYYWINRGRVFLYQEGDSGSPSPKKSNVDSLFMKALEEAEQVFKAVQLERKNREAEWIPSSKPPPYIKIKTNKPVGNVRTGASHASSLTPCECSPDAEDPCGPDSDCLNRLLMTECNPEICPAGTKCCNQQFEKRKYPQLVPYQTCGRGWGLKTLEPIKKGQFVIEYVGEMINEAEYQRRIKRMNEQKHENYYFLTIDKDRMLDAGPKGNVARFMNHSCQPNCETQKWTVNGNTRVGLFALQDIPADTELTFNYNLECIGKEKKICKCGAPVCSGFIGVKVKQIRTNEKLENQMKTIKRKIKYFSPKLRYISKSKNSCFVCGKNGSEGKCRSKLCSKMYHKACVQLEEWPEGENWWCPRHKCVHCFRIKQLKWCSKCVRSFCPQHVENNFIEGISENICTLHKEQKDNSIEKKDEPVVNLLDELSRIKVKKKMKNRISLSLKHKQIFNETENDILNDNSDSAKIKSSENNEIVHKQKKRFVSKQAEKRIKKQLKIKKLSLRNTVEQPEQQEQQATSNNDNNNKQLEKSINPEQSTEDKNIISNEISPKNKEEEVLTLQTSVSSPPDTSITVSTISKIENTKRKRGRPRKLDKTETNIPIKIDKSPTHIKENITSETSSNNTVNNFTPPISQANNLNQNNNSNVGIDDKIEVEMPLKKRKMNNNDGENKMKKRKILAADNANQQQLPKRLLRNSMIDNNIFCKTDESLTVVLKDDCNLPIRKRSGLRSLT